MVKAPETTKPAAHDDAEPFGKSEGNNNAGGEVELTASITSSSGGGNCRGGSRGNLLVSDDATSGCNHFNNITNEADGRLGGDGNTLHAANDHDHYDTYEQRGIEYDPDAKPPPGSRPAAVEQEDGKKILPLMMSSKFIMVLLVVIVTVIVFGAVTGAVLMIPWSDDGDDSSAVANSEREERLQMFRARIVEGLGSSGIPEPSSLKDPSSPYFKALDWIANRDPMMQQQLQLQLEEEQFNNNATTVTHFLQRYVLAYLYYATTVDGPWRSCNPPEAAATTEDAVVAANNNNNNNNTERENADELAAAEATANRTTSFCYFKQVWSYHGGGKHYDQSPWSRWLSNVSECSWAGIYCNEDRRVYKIDLGGTNLSGTFPEGIVHLERLESIDFERGSLRGPLPTDLVPKLPNLVDIRLSYNAFTGRIPSEWWTSSASPGMKTLLLGYNQLVGEIPAEIGALTNLTWLQLNHNRFSGELPEEISKLTQLESLRLGRNRFRGRLSTALGLLTNLDHLAFDRNLFEGSIPREIGNLTNLGAFFGHSNLLTGSIPEGLWTNATWLHEIRLSNNKLNGTLSPSVGNLKWLDELHLQDNDLEGPIPPELASSPSINKLYLQGNNFTGSVPQALCNLRGGDSAASLHVLEADCASNDNNNSSEIPEVTCPDGCCTKCCNAKGECFDDTF